MKLVSYRKNNGEAWRAGLYEEGYIVEMNHLFPDAPDTIPELLGEWEVWGKRLQTEVASKNRQGQRLKREEVQLGSPLPRPGSFRDFYAFEAHVKTARAQRGLEMVPEWYEFPVFYFSNTAAFSGPEAVIRRPKATQWLDYELEVACVIGKAGVNISVEEVAEHIAGYCILNDWSARDIQREEVKVGLGPAKGKDFATSMGPWLVTPDELENTRIAGERGDRYDLAMVARVNGVEYSRGNLKDLHFTFAEMIARASADCMLYPGDVIGSGTVGTGCILELGAERYGWLAPGDVVELEVERLGILRNRISE
ncbi:fumarylacetoacetate hydrolase family protein [Brevibacillus choshinensis]|uniref:fumarylacetoacetate hydrolase family protein n=1 Tax=Brevibacillus choshinensis TaxID=54911 RepID=UPI002E202BBC|nr:fumarylacetoacetate hydrolase family protein [Brevibacillus choshinensis]